MTTPRRRPHCPHIAARPGRAAPGRLRWASLPRETSPPHARPGGGPGPLGGMGGPARATRSKSLSPARPCRTS
eukprot:8979190-Pyramimonas_sp.AAC.1